MTHAERQALARRMDSYTVYNNNTHTVVTTGTFNDVEEYITNKQYTVVHDYSGYTVSEQVGACIYLPMQVATDHDPQLPYLARRARLQKKKCVKQ